MRQLLDHAIDLYIGGELTQAELLFQKILTSDPSLPDPHPFLGLIAFQRNQLKKAASYFCDAAKLKNSHAYLKKALLQVEQIDRLFEAGNVSVLSESHLFALLGS